MNAIVMMTVEVGIASFRACVDEADRRVMPNSNWWFA